MSRDVRACTICPPSPPHDRGGNRLVRSEADLRPIIERVKPIIAAVKAVKGDEALARFCARDLDKAPGDGKTHRLAAAGRVRDGRLRRRRPESSPPPSTPSTASAASTRRRSPRRCG